MNELKVYYWSVCPHCRATMEWLKQKGIPFEAVTAVSQPPLILYSLPWD